MAINLKDALRRKLPINKGGDVFTFQTIGDQIDLQVPGSQNGKDETRRGQRSNRRTSSRRREKGRENEENDSRQTGSYVFFLNTTLTREFDAAPSALGDVFHIQLAEIRPD